MSASVAPDVKTISFALAPTRSATCSRALSTAASAAPSRRRGSGTRRSRKLREVRAHRLEDARVDRRRRVIIEVDGKLRRRRPIVIPARDFPICKEEEEHRCATSSSRPASAHGLLEGCGRSRRPSTTFLAEHGLENVLERLGRSARIDAVVTDDPEIVMEIFHEIPGAIPVYLARARRGRGVHPRRPRRADGGEGLRAQPRPARFYSVRISD